VSGRVRRAGAITSLCAGPGVGSCEDPEIFDHPERSIAWQLTSIFRPPVMLA
jgi:hypothetical protein